MNPSPAASMIGPLTRPNVMTVFAAVFTMPIVSGTRGKGCGWGAVTADDRETNGTRVHSKIHSFAYLAAARAVGGVEHSRSGKGDFHWFSFGIGRMKTTTASRGAP